MIGLAPNASMAGAMRDGGDAMQEHHVHHVMHATDANERMRA